MPHKYNFPIRVRKVLDNKIKQVKALKLPEKNCAVIRLGAYGDLMQATSVVAGLKEQGYDITFYCSQPAADILLNNPNIDRFFYHPTDELTLQELGCFWQYLNTNVHQKVVNLSESVEGTWLALPERINYTWDYETRHRHLNYNYLQHQHELAGIENIANIKFYPTNDEMAWAYDEREDIKAQAVIVWVVAGSATHKISPHIHDFIDCITQFTKGIDVVLIGSEKDKLITKGIDNPRVHDMCGKWTPRQTFTFVQQHADLLIGPETGIMSGMSCEPTPKIVLLSHSTVNNLTRDWYNTTSLSANDEMFIHRMFMNELWHTDNDGKVQIAECQRNIPFNDIWLASMKALNLI